MDDISAAAEIGVSVIRIATHSTEADISIQHFGLARKLDLETVGFLMMAHSVAPEVLAKQARIMVDAGCQCVYVVDSAGALVLEQVSDRVSAVVAEIGKDAGVGFHGHENLALGVANSICAIRAGATQIDGSARRFGAGAGNTPTEALAAVCEKLGIRTGIDILRMFDVAEEIVRPVMDAECTLDRLSLIMGYAGVYSSFLRHAYRAADRYGVSGAEILLRCGERKLVGGQEDQIIEIAVDLAEAKNRAVAVAATG
jgi:4-hydroxy 2-oxovalerate aldolase